MTEARGHLQEAPREGAADLVARASVTPSSMAPPWPVSSRRPIDHGWLIPSPVQSDASRSANGTGTNG